MPRAADLSGWTVAVDTNIFVQRFFRTPLLLSAKIPNSSASAGSNGRRHLRGMYNLAEYARSIDVVPVFVFDGLGRVDEKANELEARRRERARIRSEYYSERERASRIRVLERIAMSLLDDTIDTVAAWTPSWQTLEAPEYPASFQDDQSSEQAPLEGTRISTGDGADAKQINDNRDIAHTSVSGAISLLETWLGCGSDVHEEQTSDKSNKRITIKDRLDELERQTCRSLLFRLGGSQDSNDTPPLGRASYDLSAMWQASNQRLATLSCRSEPLTPEHMHDCWQLLKSMGYATHVAESAESECICARLTRAGVADAVCSEDLDVVAFGGRRLLRG
ncbi:hypothetical protein GGI22_003466, partial [Coemansia erecta]